MIGKHFVGVAKRAAEQARDKRPQFARVVKIDGVRVDLEIGQSRNITKNVQVIGDTAQLAPNDTVQIAWWENDRPVAIVGASLANTTERLGTVEKRLDAIHTTRPVSAPNATGGISDWQILHFSKGALASVHSPDESGMDDALAVCLPGDNILLPTIELAMSFTIPDGVTVTGISRFGSVISGTVTLGPGSALETLRVFSKLDSADASIAVKGPASGKARINNCDVWAWNCGSGEAIGILSENNAVTYAQKCYVAGETRYHNGRAVKITSGKVQLEDCKEYGDADNSGDVDVYNVFGGETEIECTPLASSVYANCLGVSNYQFDPVFTYHVPSTIQQSSFTDFYPLLYSTNYIFGIGEEEDQPKALKRKSVSTGAVDTLGSFGLYQSISMYSLVTVIDDSTAYVADYVNDDGWYIYKADFATNSWTQIAYESKGTNGYSIAKAHLVSCVIDDVVRLTLFGLVDYGNVAPAENSTRFFWRTYTVGTGWGTEHIEFLSVVQADPPPGTLNDYAALALSQCYGVIEGSRLIAVCTQDSENQDGFTTYDQQKRILSFFDINVVADTHTREVYVTVPDPEVDQVGINMLQVNRNIVMCDDGLYVPVYSPGEQITRWIRYDLGNRSAAYAGDIQHNSYGATDGVDFYFVYGASMPNYMLYNSAGSPLFPVTVPTWKALLPSIVDGRVWIFNEETHILSGYLLTNGDDIVPIDLLSSGAAGNDVYIADGYIIHEAVTSGTITYYVDKEAS